MAVSVTLPPVQNVVGPPAVMVGVNAPMFTVAVPLFEQPLPSAIDTPSCTGAPVGVKLIAFVPWPVNVAFVTVQLNVAPLSGGTLAELLVFAHMLAGALIVALGCGLTVTTMGDVEPLQPFVSVAVAV